MQAVENLSQKYLLEQSEVGSNPLCSLIGVDIFHAPEMFFRAFFIAQF
mgnify:CR=1 FL=1